MKFVKGLLLSVVFCLTGCSSKIDMTVAVDSTVESLCLEQFAAVPITKINQELSDLDVKVPFEVFGVKYGVSGSRVYFDVLNTAQKVVHVAIIRSGEDFIITHEYDTPEEWKTEIMRCMSEMIGPDVDVIINDRYTDYVEVKAQGDTFRWSDGKLERVP